MDLSDEQLRAWREHIEGRLKRGLERMEQQFPGWVRAAPAGAALDPRDRLVPRWPGEESHFDCSLVIHGPLEDADFEDSDHCVPSSVATLPHLLVSRLRRIAMSRQVHKNSPPTSHIEWHAPGVFIEPYRRDEWFLYEGDKYKMHRAVVELNTRFVAAAAAAP